MKRTQRKTRMKDERERERKYEVGRQNRMWTERDQMTETERLIKK